MGLIKKRNDGGVRLPFCEKCGAELKEDAKFCPTCGTPVAPLVAEPERRIERRPISTLAIVLIAIIVIAAITVAIAFLPVRTVEATGRHSVPYKPGVNTLNLDFTADVAGVNIAFEDHGKLITLDFSITARVGIFVSPDIFDRYRWYSSSDTTVGNVLTVTSEVDIPDRLRYSWLNVTCDIRIDTSINANLNIKTSTGGIVMDTQAEVVLNSLSLEATTGGVEANLVEDVVVAGDVSAKTTTGGVKFSWDNVIITDDVLVNLEATTGGVDVDVTQEAGLLHDITLGAETTTGGVAFAIDIQGDIGAKIESTVTTGGINIDRQVGFSGPESLLQSDNYPAGSNFILSLKTTTGGIDIDAKYTPQI